MLLQHADGGAALPRADVDAWAGLDPMMAAAELAGKARLLYRNADANSSGISNVREEFAAEHPDIIERVLGIYEEARLWALDHPGGLAELLADEAGVQDEVVQEQLSERTELTHDHIGEAQRTSILEAGLELQQAGVIEADVDVAATLDELVDDSFPARSRIERRSAQTRAGQLSLGGIKAPSKIPTLTKTVRSPSAPKSRSGWHGLL